jgi:glutamine phosphoribosylpyrophosphate amidotransferase
MNKLKVIAREASRRGPHAAGIAYRVGNDIMTVKQQDISNVDSLFANTLDARAIVGNCRLSTSGTHKAPMNNQPLVLGNIAISHNGNIPDVAALADGLGVELRTKCDSEIILHLIAAYGVDHAVSTIWHDYAPFALLIMHNSKYHVISAGQPLYRVTRNGATYYCSRPFDGASPVIDRMELICL